VTARPMSVSFRPLPSGSSTVRQPRCGPLCGIPPPVVDHLAFVWLPVCSQMTRAEWDFTRQHTNSERESAVNNKRLIGSVSQNAHRQAFRINLKFLYPTLSEALPLNAKGQDSPPRQSGRVAGASHSASAGGASFTHEIVLAAQLPCRTATC
jgi:hypothetical protein